jgi:hypothetical protein
MSLLWVRAVRHPEVRQVPVREVLKAYRPTEGRRWDDVRREYHQEHPVMMKSLRQDFADRGITSPVDVFRDGDGWAVHNGHHRILAAEPDQRDVPVRHWESESDIPRTKRYWDPETRENYGPEEDENDEGQLRY